jgi:glucokinase
MCIVLVGDIGGTNARLELSELKSRKCCPKLIKKVIYQSQDFKSLDACIEKFLEEFRHTDKWPAHAVLACAGAPINNRVSFSNLPWIVDGNYIQKKFNLERCELINDFTAKGYSILRLNKEELIHIHDFPEKIGETKLVIGPGTGLGVCLCQEYPTEKGISYVVKGMESGHATFSAADELEWEWSRYYLEKEEEEGYMEIEKAFCGPSIPLMYEFFCEKRGVKAEDLRSEDVFEKGVREDGPCRETVNLFLKIYGRIASDVALMTMPFGGIYLVGNMTVYLKEFFVKS